MVVWLTGYTVTAAGLVGIPPNVVTSSDDSLVIRPKSFLTVKRYWYVVKMVSPRCSKYESVPA